MNEIVSITTLNPVAVLTDATTYSEFYASIKAQLSEFVPDVSTERGRKEIASMAYKVTRSKTAIDEAGKKLNEEARSKINAVDAQRRKIREELDELAEEVRAPLTKWEEAERARVSEAKAIRENVIGLGNSSPHETVQDIRDRIDSLAAIVLTGAVLGDEYSAAVADRDKSLAYLHNHLARAVKAEEDAAELARLREAQEARERAEREAAEKAERERLERERQAKADAEYKANVARAAEEARQAEIAKAKAERDRIEREAAEAVAKAEAEARRIKEAAERADRERQEAADRVRREEEARQADRTHRSTVMTAAKEAIMAHGPDEAVAKAIVLAIVANEIPHVSLRF